MITFNSIKNHCFYLSLSLNIRVQVIVFGACIKEQSISFYVFIFMSILCTLCILCILCIYLYFIIHFYFMPTLDEFIQCSLFISALSRHIYNDYCRKHISHIILKNCRYYYIIVYSFQFDE